MHLNVPPIIPYAVGAMLVIFGILRAKYLSAPRTPRMTEEDAETSDEPSRRSRQGAAPSPAHGRGLGSARALSSGLDLRAELDAFLTDDEGPTQGDGCYKYRSLR
jgi:hypothetical protein